MNRFEMLPDDIVANIYEVNRKQDLQKIQDLEEQIEKLTDKNERMKDQLLNEEYIFCDKCQDFEYEPVNWFQCKTCYKDCCSICIEDEDIVICDTCNNDCCKDCIYDYKNYYHLCIICLTKEAIKTIKFNPIFRKYLFKIRN